MPARRRDIKALRVTGFSYQEIGEMRGLTYPRVNRMIAEADAVLRTTTRDRPRQTCVGETRLFSWGARG